jgi:PAS domain S-box-containing protein
MDLLFSKISEAVAYCQLITDQAGKPLDWLYLAVNEAYEKINGVTKDDVVGKRATEVLPNIQRDPSDWINLYAKVALTGESIVTERFAEARNKWYHVSAYCPEKGYFVAIFEDITERKKTEKELRKAKDDWERTFDAVPDFMALLDTEFKIVRVNQAMAQQLKVNPQKVIGQICFECIHGTNTPPDNCPHAQLHKDGKQHTAEIHEPCLGGDFLVSATPLKDENGNLIGSVHVARNITERKKTEQAIQRQADLIDLSPEAIIVRKMDGTITFWSKGAEKIYGWTKKEALGKTTHELFQTKYPQPFDDILAELKEKQRWTGELIHRTKHGTEAIVQSWWLAEQTEHGEITSILESNVDLTEHKKVEKEITRLASYPTLNPSPVIEVDTSGKITYINPATNLLFPDLAKLGLNHSFFCDWKDTVKRFSNKNSSTFGREVQVKGHWYHQQFYLVPQTKNIRIYTTDIDELKQTEEAHAQAQNKLEENAVMLEEYASQMEELAEQRAEELKNSERLAAIGQTAGVVGHDIRNPLQAITSDMYIIAEETRAMQNGESKQAILESIDSVNQNLTYINKIVSDLQDYTRPLRPNLQDANLADLIEGTLLTINIPKGIRVSTEIGGEAKPIRTDVAYMRRILTNLMTNAVQAMPEEGKLSVKASKEKGVIIICVADTGSGIPQEVQARMFTPLFTTKSKGQGLGLAVVKRLAEALDGTISFESHENKGTKFIVKFPQTN